MSEQIEYPCQSEYEADDDNRHRLLDEIEKTLERLEAIATTYGTIARMATRPDSPNTLLNLAVASGRLALYGLDGIENVTTILRDTLQIDELKECQETERKARSYEARRRTMGEAAKANDQATQRTD